MDDLLLKVAELADPKLTIGSSDVDNDKILFDAACQFDPVPPSTAKKPLATYISQIDSANASENHFCQHKMNKLHVHGQ